MSDDVLVTFTGRSLDEMIDEGGCQAWALKAQNARRRTYLLCTRNQAHPLELTGGPEPHGSAFLVGRISAIEPAPENPDRFIIRFNEYAALDPPIPGVWPGNQNPVFYAKEDLNQLGIDEAALHWQRVGAPLVDAAPGTSNDTKWPPQHLTIAEAKKALAETFGVRPDHVEITIRG